VGILVLVLTLFTVAFPWYFVAWKDPSSSCEVLQLQSWIDVYCMSKSCPQVISDVCSKMNNNNWQDDCAGVDGCDDRKRAFDVSLGLTAVSTFCALFVSIGFCIRCCSESYKRKNPLHVVTTLMSFVLLVGALIYFAVQVPKTNYWCTSQHLPFNCDSFWGHDSATGFTYGPAGWVAGVFTAVVVLISLCMSCQRSGDEIELGTYYNVGEHGEGSYGRASGSAPHNFTSANSNYAGTNYVGNSSSY